MRYAPEARQAGPVVEPGAFVFAAAYFDHGHIYGQTFGLANAGGTLRYLYDPVETRLAPVRERFPDARVVQDFQTILDDPEVQLVTAAAIPDRRCAIGLKVLEARKHYLTDKAPFTTLEQLEQARATVAATGKRYAVCYSERLMNEAAWHAGTLIAEGRIGRVLQVLNLAPHNLAAATRPDWFFKKQHYGGILTDIGSHQFEQFLAYSGARDATIRFARVANLDHPSYPELEDFGEAALTLDTGASAYCRLDWFNPKGSKVWGDGRTFVLGTEGTLEVRKYRDLIHGGSDRIYLVDAEGEHVIDCAGTVGFPYFGLVIRDCLEGTETAMTQAHAFKAAELSLKAQLLAEAAQP